MSLEATGGNVAKQDDLSDVVTSLQIIFVCRKVSCQARASKQNS